MAGKVKLMGATKTKQAIIRSVRSIWLIVLAVRTNCAFGAPAKTGLPWALLLGRPRLSTAIVRSDSATSGAGPD